MIILWVLAGVIPYAVIVWKKGDMTFLDILAGILLAIFGPISWIAYGISGIIVGVVILLDKLVIWKR